MADDLLSQYRQLYELWLGSKDLPKGGPSPTASLSADLARPSDFSTQDIIFDKKTRDLSGKGIGKILGGAAELVRKYTTPLGALEAMGILPAKPLVEPTSIPGDAPEDLLKWIPQLALGAGQHLAQTGVNAAESIRQVATPVGWAEKLGWIPKSPIPGSKVGSQGPLDAVGSVVNAAMLGAPSGFSDQYAEAYTRSGEQSPDGEGSYGGALASTVYDALPFEEIIRATTGQDENGKDLTTGELGQAVGMGALEGYPALKLMQGAKAAIKNGVTSGLQAEAREVYTKSQLQDAASRMGAGEAFVKPVEGAVADEVLSVGQHKASVDSVLASKTVMDKIVDRGVAARGEGPIMTAVLDVVKGIDEGSIGSDYILKMADDLGVPAETIVDHMIDTFGSMKKTASGAGRILYDTQRLNRSGISRKILDLTKQLTTDATKLAALDELSIAAKPTYMFSRFNDLYKRFWLKPERGLAIVQPQTVMRNIITQGLTSAQTFGEEMLAETMLAGIGKTRQALGLEAGKSLGDYFHGSQQQLAQLIHTLSPESRQLFNDVLTELPGESRRLFGSPINSDVIMRTSMKKEAQAVGAGQLADQVIDTGLGLANMPNTFQEFGFRRFHWQNRADANLQRLGYKGGLEEVLPQLRTLKASEALDPKIAHAFADATDYALKNTYSFTPPEGTFGGAVLKMYKDMPILADLAHLFPRYLTNQYRHLWERNPLNGLSLFNKEFRNTLFKASNGELAQREAAMVLSKAVSGTVNFGGALAMRAMPGAQALKYYQLDKGDGEPVDLRAFQPFSSYLFAADMARAWSQGLTHPANLTPNEMADAVAGMRNLSEVPIFAIDDIIKRMDNSDPTSFMDAITKMGGKKLGIFLTPLQTVLDVGSATGIDQKLYGQDWSTQKDTSNQLFAGPVMSKVPGMRDLLPDRPDAFASGPAKNNHPALKQMGITIQQLRPIEQLTQQLGMGMGEVVGQYDNPVANRLVTKYMGEILGMKNKEGIVLGDSIVKLLNSKTDARSQHLPAPLMTDILRELLADARALAVQAAMAENSGAFREHIIKGQHSATLSDIDRKIREYKSSSKTGPYDPLHLQPTR